MDSCGTFVFVPKVTCVAAVAGEAPIKIRRGNGCRRLCAQTLHQIQFCERVCGHRYGCVLALALQSKEEEILILAEVTADRPAKLLAAKFRRRLPVLF